MKRRKKNQVMDLYGKKMAVSKEDTTLKKYLKKEEKEELGDYSKCCDNSKNCDCYEQYDKACKEAEINDYTRKN